MEIAKLKIAGIIGQWISAFICGTGIGIEIALGAEIGFVLITAGSVLFAGFTKLRYLSRKKEVEK